MTSSTRLRIGGPTDLLDAIPHLIGFQPHGSVVVVALEADGQMVATARMDLADTVPSGVLGTCVERLLAAGARRFLAAVVDDTCPAPSGPPDTWPWAAVVAELGCAVEDGGAELVEVVLQHAGRWWSYLCSDPICCPPEGTSLIEGTSVFAAESAVRGVVVLPDRAALAATLAGLTDTERALLDAPIAAAEHAAVDAVLAGRGGAHERGLAAEIIAAARASSAPGWLPPDDATAGRFAAALTVIAVRDEVWMRLDRRRADGSALWRELAGRCPRPYDAAPLFLLAWASWRSGQGALARIAVERTVSSDPAYSAADLLLAALAQGVDPRRFPRLGTPERAPVRGRRRRARPAGAARTPR